MTSPSAGSTSDFDVNGPKKSAAKCCFVGCGRTQRKFPLLHFFRFPVNRPSVLEQWLINCGNEDLITLPNKTLHGKRVCEKHFTFDCFTSDMRKYLKKDAIPTLLQHDEPFDVPEPQSGSMSMSETVTSGQGINAATISESKPTNHHDEVLVNLGESSPTQSTSLHCQSCPKTPTTPLIKRFKSSKDRTPTPRKKILTPMKRKLLTKLRMSQKSNNKFQKRAKRLAMRTHKITKDELVAALKDYLPPAVSNFVSMQLNHANAPKKPWTEDERRVALSMSYKSPRFYEHMRRDGFVLPSKSTIARWLQEVDFKPGICQDLIKAMKAKVDCMSQWEKKAVLLFDEMQIKTGLEYDSMRDVVEGLQDLGELGRTRDPGTKVLLFMARGLTHKWKMPFAYFIVKESIKSETISQIVRMCVTKLQETGLDIKSVVCDQSTTNRGAATKMGVSLKKPYFRCQGKKVYWIYDFPHVVKCIRNNLMKKNKNGHYVGKIENKDGVASWMHISQLFDLDQSSVTARATKLTEKHLNPNSFEKMSVKLATQVFSHSVSTAMTTAVDTGQLPQEAKETAKFIKRMNDVFDAMNSRAQFDPNPCKCAISNSTNVHLAKSRLTIKSGILWVRTWKMVDTKKRPPSFIGMEHTLKATLLLWNDIQAEGVAYLITSRLNQDPLENEFSIARQRCGYNKNPTARLFRQNMRHRIKCALLQPPTGSNCEPDEDGLIEVACSSSTSMNASTSSGKEADKYGNVEEMDELEVGLSFDESEGSDEEDLESFPSTPAENKNCLEACAVRYFAGYAVRACLKKFKCQTCLHDLVQAAAPNVPDEALIRNRQYSDASGETSEALISPTQMTVDAANTTLVTFEKMLIKSIHTIGIRKSILTKCKQAIYKYQKDWMKCGFECYQHRMFLVKKLITAKLQCKLQEQSKKMRQPGGKYGGFYQKVKILGGN